MKKMILRGLFVSSCLGVASTAMAASVGSVKTTQKLVQTHNGAHLIAAAGDRNNSSSAFAVFAPKSKTLNTTIDYETFDAALQNVVVRFGQSIRVRAPRPDPMLGTRRISGHTSPYRLEGSRVTFSRLNDEYREALTAYRKDLERVASNVDLTHFDRKEQLAFWFNLHNVTLIEQIAYHYPVKEPQKLRVGPDNELLDEAKILNIRGVPMSLRDIREKVVYPNWDNPDVIYGFFEGNIGGPALQNYAFNGSNVDSVLELQAKEFVNSLRGFHEARKSLKVSTLYEDVRPFYFKSWPNDLKAHLRKHADPEVLKELASKKPIEFDRYEATVADLNGGYRGMTADLNLRIDGRAQTVGVSPEAARLLRELAGKTEIMKQRGMILGKKGKVTIEDVPTIDVDIPPSSLKKDKPLN